MADCPVKYFHSAMQGAPVISGTPGSRIAALHACLVTGFSLKTLDSLVVADGVATGTISTGGVAYEVGSVIRVAGAMPATLNGDQRVTACTASTVAFAAPGVADGAAGGTITVQQAPVGGWTREFYDDPAHVAVFKGAIEGTGTYLRCDDSGATDVRVVGYESMADVDTGSGPFPAAAQIAGGGYWPVANAANAAARSWELIGDDRGFLLKIHTATTNPGASGSIWSFGDLASLMPADAYGCLLQCAAGSVATSTALQPAALEHMSLSYAGTGSYTPRDVLSQGASTDNKHGVDAHMSDATARASGSTAMAATPLAPLPAGGAFALARKTVRDPQLGLRGWVRGLYLLPQAAIGVITPRSIVPGIGALAGRSLLALAVGSPAGIASQGVALVDVTGPWE